MHLKTQKFLILGLSKSGVSVVKYALSKGAFCFIYEQLKNPKIEQAISELTELGAVYVDVDTVNGALENSDVIVLSPGVPINHEIAVNAKKLGKRIIGELEFGFLQFTPPLIAVTGTNGKTTTVTLIDAALREDGRKSCLVGNVGVPITSKIAEIDSDTYCVTEVSSFQLESVNAFCPHVACVLNLTPDHLERHYTMENYIFLKKRIFKNQRESEFTVLNYDDLTVRGFSMETRGKIIWVSLIEQVDGAYVSNGNLYWKGEQVISEAELRLKGKHNVYDSLFAIACLKLVGVKTESIYKAFKNFKGVKHRTELVAQKNGISFYNDSKATNTSSTISALSMMTAPTVLILGGSEKGEEYFELFKKIKESTVKHVVLTGASRFNMLDAAGKVGFSDLTLTSDFDVAIKIACVFAESGDNVLLSPACASFDKFSSFEERGEHFIKVLEGLD